MRTLAITLPRITFILVQTIAITLGAVVLGGGALDLAAPARAAAEPPSVPDPTFDAEGSPKELAGWSAWIRARHPEWQCAMGSSDAPVCVFPGRLAYTLQKDGAAFTAEAELLSKGTLPLPSDSNLYPKDISVSTIDNTAVDASITVEDGRIGVLLPKGRYKVTGSFRWSEAPRELPVPAAYGIVSVFDEQIAAERSLVRGESSIQLEDPDKENAGDSISLLVMRQIRDGSPLNVETLLRFRVSGAARPLNVGQVLLSGGTPVSVQADMPHHLSPDGNLALQLTPGEFDVRISSVHAQPVTKLSLPAPTTEAWPKDEIWSWVPDTAFRSAELRGAEAVHAELTQLPDDWKQGAIFALPSGSAAELVELRRGEQAVPPNAIDLNRELWIDFDGSGMTVVDRFSGTMNQGFRLDALQQTDLGRATVDGVPQLITTNVSNGSRGVELRSQRVDAELVSRITGLQSFPAVGWTTPVSSLNTTINLPPSWKLVHVGGAHTCKQSWIGSWTLLDLFVDVLLVVAAFKLFGSVLAIILAASLLLNHGEHLAPQIFIIHMVLLSIWRLLLTDESSVFAKLCKLLLATTYSVWTLHALAFGKLQLTQLLYPQLPAGTRFRTVLQSLLLGLESNLFSWPLLLLCLGIAFFAVRSVIRPQNIWKRLFKLALFGGVLLVAFGIFIANFVLSVNFEARYSDSMELSGSSYSPYPATRGGSAKKGGYDDLYQSQAPGEAKTLQSGPAVPSWRWHKAYASFDGPVQPSEQLTLHLLPPAVGRVLCGARLILILTLVVMLGKAFGYGSLLRRLEPSASDRMRGPGALPTLATVCLVMAAILGAPSTSRADIPTDSIMKELEAQLSRDRCTRDRCAIIEQLVLSLDKTKFTAKLIVSSDGPGVVTIPGPLGVLQPASVEVNGAASNALRRSAQGFLELKVGRGKSVIELHGTMPPRPAFSLQFVDRPFSTTVTTDDWFVEGLLPTGSIPDALRFTDRSSSGGEQGFVADSLAVLPTWFKVTRAVRIGEQILVHSEIERIGESTAPVRVRVPLFQGERVLSGGVTIEQDSASVLLPAGETKGSFSSSLQSASPLVLDSKQSPRVSQEWLVACDPFIACDVSGIRPTSSVTDGKSAYLWIPFPGESVSVAHKQLNAAKGEYLTVDSVTHEVSRGASVSTASLNVSVRATKQGTLTAALPNGAIVRAIKLDGQNGAGSTEKEKVTILLNPGPHEARIEYEIAGAPVAMEHAPPITLNVPAHNVTVIVRPDTDRWLVWTGGAFFGPSVLFWSKFVLLAVVFVLLAKVGLLPITAVTAVVLAFGLSLVPIVALCIPIVWLMLLSLLPRIPAYVRRIPRAAYLTMMVSLTLLALIVLYAVVYVGLVEWPPMLVAGNVSTAGQLRWLVDHSGTTLPTPWTFSIPLWIWRMITLAWSTWLVVKLIDWFKRLVVLMRAEKRMDVPVATSE